VETQDVKKSAAAVSARIPGTLKQLMKRFIAMDAHVNESDFIRDAIREKIQRDAPDLYRQLFREVTT
jgi:Arc/MetJ-type ribon-helix-helix transcriptional regulator